MTRFCVIIDSVLLSHYGVNWVFPFLNCILNLLNLLNHFATSICKYVTQVVLVHWQFCTGIYFCIDTNTQLTPVFVKKEDQCFKKFDKFSKPKNGKTQMRCTALKFPQNLSLIIVRFAAFSTNTVSTSFMPLPWKLLTYVTGVNSINLKEELTPLSRKSYICNLSLSSGEMKGQGTGTEIISIQ